MVMHSFFIYFKCVERDIKNYILQFNKMSQICI